MANVSEVIIRAHPEAVAYLAALGTHRKQLSARITFEHAGDGIPPTKTAFKAASEAVAAIIAAAQYPFWIEPADLVRAVEQQSISRPVAQAAVATLEASDSIKPAAEQPNADQVATLLTSLLVSNPYLGRGIKEVRPTHASAPAATEDDANAATPDRPESFVGTDWPLDTPAPPAPAATEDDDAKAEVTS